MTSMPDLADSETLEISDRRALLDHPLVSVYMGTYNHERYIQAAIEGVIAQKVAFPVELIIGEDCSTDRTRNIVLGYQARHPELIRVLTGDKNVGAHNNYRRCFQASRGKYFAFCEGDDYWHTPTKLQMQVDLMEANPQMTVCHTDYDRQTRWHLLKNRHASANSPYLATGNAYSALLHRWSVMTATAMYRRSVLVEFQETPFYNTSWPFGDYNKLLFASLRGTVGYIPISTAVHRKVKGSAGNKSAAADLRIHLANDDCREMFLRAQPLQRDEENEIRGISKRSIYTAAFFAGNLHEFIESYRWLSQHRMAPNKLLHGLRYLCLKTKIGHIVWRTVKYSIDLHISSMPR